MKRALAIGTIKRGVRTMVLIEHADGGAPCLRLRVDELPERPKQTDTLDLPDFLKARRETA